VITSRCVQPEDIAVSSSLYKIARNANGDDGRKTIIASGYRVNCSAHAFTSSLLQQLEDALLR
jgi:hypothetical protein